MPSKPSLFHPVSWLSGASKLDYDQGKRKSDPRLAEAARIRNSSDWQKTRAHFLAINPICGACLYRLASSVHHIEPLSERPDLAFDWENLASICDECKPKIDARERAGFETASYFAKFERQPII
jgi:5-methylcytosine-specific restriction endonuclease McrA